MLCLLCVCQTLLRHAVPENNSGIRGATRLPYGGSVETAEGTCSACNHELLSLRLSSHLVLEQPRQDQVLKTMTAGHAAVVGNRLTVPQHKHSFGATADGGGASLHWR